MTIVFGCSDSVNIAAIAGETIDSGQDFWYSLGIKEGVVVCIAYPMFSSGRPWGPELGNGC